MTADTIYINVNFFCYIPQLYLQAELKAVSPSEDFTCSLGVDPAVKVVYKPLNKFREQSGLITKTLNTVYKQVRQGAVSSFVLNHREHLSGVRKSCYRSSDKAHSEKKNVGFVI